MTNKNEQRKVPELRFPEFSGEWEEKKLKDITEKISDGLHSTPIYDEYGEISFINGNNLKNGKVVLKDSKKVSLSEFNKYRNNLKKNRSILLSINGTIGNIAYYRGEKILLGKSAAYINHNEDMINRMFLFFTLQTQRIQKYFWSELTGTTIKNLSLNSISNTKIISPKYEEQQKIGEFFSKLDRQIELEEKKLALLEEQKKGYMQKIFSQELRFKDENGEEYPEWRWTNIKNEIDLITDYVSNGSFESLRKNVSYSSNSDYAIVIRLQDANNDWKGPFVYTNKEGYEFLSKTKLYKNDLIMSNVGSVGVFYRIPELEKPMTLGPNSILLRSKKNNNTFLYYFLNSHELRKRVFEKSTPGVQLKINKTDLKSISFNLPSIDEQNIIANLFDCIEKSLVNIKNRKYKREILKKELLNRMFL